VILITASMVTASIRSSHSFRLLAPAIGRITTDPSEVLALVLDAVHEPRGWPHQQKIIQGRRLLIRVASQLADAQP
jgi:hypothetical protein